jgi:hypothetical protein
MKAGESMIVALYIAAAVVHSILFLLYFYFGFVRRQNT